MAMNSKLKRYLYLAILGVSALSIVGLFQVLQKIGINIGFDTDILFLPVRWVLFILLGVIFYDIARGRVI